MPFGNEVFYFLSDVATLSLIIFREIPDITCFVALVLMISGTWLSSQNALYP
jgi:hypothetical protein